MERKIPNRLIHEKSPYLLQHAYNPVDWFPWSEEAFNLAREKDCLVFLSIGYATCHWCHVMEKESFEDKKTADFLNEHFVSIKVDREERPDIDSIYMDALQAMEGQGGWPLNMFLTPEKIPVIGGTYFPSEPRYGRKSFLDVLGILHVTWKEKRGDIIKASEEMLRFLQSSVREQQSEELPSESCIQKTYETYNHFYDETYFGFKTNASNKFPPSMGLSFLISYFIKTKNSKAKEMVEKTLLAMKKGGIYDQVGGGLCRYSTDSMWLVPHFEKMLYDNALFISILAETYRLEKREIFKQAALDVINYVERDLVLDEGGIASAEDADSEGEEGKFYLWDLSHFQEILGTDAEFFSAYWHLSEEGNFEGKNILNENFRIYPLPEEEDSSLSARKEKVRKSLLEERNKRIRPQRDDKVLTSWNCLYIRALIESGMSFSDESLIQKAKNHYEFINTHLFNSEGRLLRRYREGESAIPAYLVDYAELAYVSILLYKISFNIDYMKRAVFLTDESIRLFYSGFGPFFETGSDAEVLIRRSIQSYDGVEPSGNSTMAMVLLELCRYGHKKYYGYLKSLFSYFKEDLEKYGMSHAFLLKVYLLYTGGPSREIIIIGEKENEELQKILNVYYTHFVPGLSFAVSTKDELSINSELIPLLKGRETEKDFVLYICENNSCKLPIFSMSDALQVLNAQFSMDEGVHL